MDESKAEPASIEKVDINHKDPSDPPDQTDPMDPTNSSGRRSFHLNSKKKEKEIESQITGTKQQ